MDPFLIFILLLLSLFVLSGAITQNLGLLVFNLTGSKNFTVGFLALLFLPGTAIHELAHAAVAQMLGVHVGLRPGCMGHVMADRQVRQARMGRRVGVFDLPQ